MTVSARILTLLGLLCLGPLSARGQEAFTPLFTPEMEIRRAPGEIQIDGVLDDPGWAGAARAVQWSENWPGDQVEPPVSSETWVTYDERNLYLAFVLQDDPSRIRANLSKRDEIWQDDYVGIILDTYGSGNWAYELFVNPLGVQGDLRWTTNGEDLSFNMVFDTEGRITEDGWQVEMAIPFKSLRFPNRPEQEWRANFWRNHPRENRNRYGWAAVDRDDPCWPCQFGILRGIGQVSAGGALDILPALVGFDESGLKGLDTENPGLQSEDSGVEAGVGVRYALTSSLSAAGTYNPDFSQVESDAAQIGVNTTFALFYPEQRPFFQEGSDLYDTWVDQVYTRSINAPDWAGKLTGRMGRNSVSALVAQDELSPYILPFEEESELVLAGRSWSTFLRLQNTYGEDNFLGLLGTHRVRRGGGFGSTLGVDWRQRFLKNYRLELQVVGSATEEPDDPSLTEHLGDKTFDGGRYTAAFDGESFQGSCSYVSIERDARHWNFDVDFRALSPTFRADNGFIFQNNRVWANAWTGYTFYTDKTPLLTDWQPSFNIARVWNWDGIRKDEWIRPQIAATLLGQTQANVAWLYSKELFRGQLFPDIERWSLYVDTRFSKPLTLGFYAETGTSIARNIDVPVLGDWRSAEFWATIRPFHRLNLQPTFAYQELSYPDGGDLIFTGYIARMKMSLQFNRELFLRFVVQYDEFGNRLGIEPLISYVVNPFTIFYLGSTHRMEDVELSPPSSSAPRLEFREDSRQIFFKVQYLFRV